jgi:hypothetical protein
MKVVSPMFEMRGKKAARACGLPTARDECYGLTVRNTMTIRKGTSVAARHDRERP